MTEEQQQKKLVRTARFTGLWYLMLAISGMVGFLMLHSRVYVSDNPAKTLDNIMAQETLARLRLLFEFIIIISQALAAIWFYKLFKDIRHMAAWSLAVWGTVNAVAIMVSAIAMGGAIDVAAGTLTINEKQMLIQLFAQLIRHSWGVGSLFFGLWLLPMGYIVISSNRMPVWLGWVLVTGGVGYVASAFIKYIGITDSWVDTLTIPATIGEFWMVGYLLIFGIRDKSFDPEANQS